MKRISVFVISAVVLGALGIALYSEQTRLARKRGGVGTPLDEVVDEKLRFEIVA